MDKTFNFTEYVHVLVERIEEFKAATIPSMATGDELASYAAVETIAAVLPYVDGRHIPVALVDGLGKVLNCRAAAVAQGQSVRITSKHD